MLLPHNQSKVWLYATLLFVVILNSTVLYSQIDNGFPCYALGKDADLQDVFYVYETASNSWHELSKVKSSDITALVSNPVTKTMYVANGHSFGTIDPENGAFVSIAEINQILYGEFGPLEITSVVSMTFDVVEQKIYAVHRISNKADVLIIIDPDTGAIIRDGFTHNETKEAVDYQPIEELQYANRTYNQVMDLTIDPLNGQLYVIHQYSGEFYLTISDKENGFIIAPLFEIKDKFVNNITVSGNGRLYALAKDLISTESHIYQVDKFTGGFNPVSKMEDDPDIQFTALEFQKPYHDLALKIEKNSNQLDIEPGDELTLDIEIINQGEIEVNYLQIVNYLSSGLTLKNDEGWQFNDSFVLLDINELLLPKQSIKKQIQFIANDDFSGTIANFAEINLYVNKYTNNGLPLVWPDIDSQADSNNDEIIYIDNEINQNGILKSEDEDDHDFVTINVNSSCTPQFSFQNTHISSALYQAGDHIYADNVSVEEGTTFEAGRAIIMNKGFQVYANANFEAKISACE